MKRGDKGRADDGKGGPSGDRVDRIRKERESGAFRVEGKKVAQKMVGDAVGKIRKRIM